MTPFGVRRNFLIMLGRRRLRAILNVLHSLYIWDSKATFLVVVVNLENQQEIFIENRTAFNVSTLHSNVIVENVFLNPNLEPITEVCKIFNYRDGYERPVRVRYKYFKLLSCICLF